MLAQSISFVINTGERIICDQSEDTTVGERIAALRFLSVTLVPVYKFVKKNCNDPQKSPDEVASLNAFRDRLQSSIALCLRTAQKLVNGHFGNITTVQRISVLRLMTRIAVPLYVGANKPQDTSSPRPRKTPSQDPDDVFTVLMKKLGMEYDNTDIPFLTDHIREALIKSREKKTQDQTIAATAQTPIAETPSETNSEPVQANTQSSFPVPSVNELPVRPDTASAANSAPAMDETPLYESQTVVTTSPVPSPHYDKPGRYAPVRPFITQQDIEWIKICMQRYPVPKGLPASLQAKHFPLPDLYPKFMEIIHRPHQKCNSQKASTPPSQPPQKPELYSDS